MSWKLQFSRVKNNQWPPKNIGIFSWLGESEGHAMISITIPILQMVKMRLGWHVELGFELELASSKALDFPIEHDSYPWSVM